MKLKKIAFSLFFLTCFLAQLITPLYHYFDECHHHNETHCSSNDVEHFCDHDSENHKHYFDLKLNYNTNYEYQFITKQQISSIDILKKDLLKNHQQLSFSLRAPPFS